MNIRLPWLYSRKNLIFVFVVEILIICFLNFFITSEFLIFAKSNIEFTLFFLTFWLIFSYILGRYSYEEEIFKNNKIVLFLKLFLLTFFVSVFSILCSFFISDNINFNNFNHFDSIIIPYSFLISLIVNIFQIALIGFFLKKYLDIQIWLMIGSEELKEYLINELKWNNKKIKILKIDDSYDFKKINIDEIEGIFIRKFEDIKTKSYRKFFELQKKGIKILSLEKWCELNLQRFPSEILSNEFLLKGNFLISSNSIQLRIKRIGDISLSIFLLLTTFPLLLFASLIIFMQDFRGFLYAQERVGLNKKIIKIFKLRSMHYDAEKGIPQWSNKSDSRITWIGKLLRKTRLDELPQLICVIKGDMSLIGPRPERELIDMRLRKYIPYYDYRYLIKPGLSGWAQVNYPYGSSIEDSKKKTSYDLYYLRNFSIWLDFLIMFKTIRLVLLRRGSNPLN